MSSIKEIRELTGLSQTKRAEWFGVSKSLIQFAEKGNRDLPLQAFNKLTVLVLLAQQMKDANKANKAEEMEFTDPAKLASRHKSKMEFHQRSAIALQVQLRKLKVLHPQINSRLALLDTMKNYTTEWYSATARMLTTGLEQQELLKDKIEVHLAYAEIHKERWEKFLKLASS